MAIRIRVGPSHHAVVIRKQLDFEDQQHEDRCNRKGYPSHEAKEQSYEPSALAR
jgi:hypothetical protein